MTRIKLMLLIPHLGGGGAERVTAMLAAHLDPARFDIQLALITADSPGAEPPPAWVRVHRFNSARVRACFPKLVGLVRREKPDIVLSNMAHLNFLILLSKLLLPRKTRILVRQNTTASFASWTWRARRFYRWLYPKADRVICQSQAMADDLATHFGIPRGKLAVLLNPVGVQSIRDRVAHRRKLAQPKSALHLLAVGRLSHEKGFDLLLEALAVVKGTFPDLTLTIIGTGPEAERLYELRRTLNLEAQVSLPGHRSDLVDQYAQAMLFVLPSRHEGMPNALIEASAAGLPIVATPCCQGVLDLLTGAPGVWIAPSISADSLAESILAAIRDLKPPQPRRFEHKFIAYFETAIAIRAYERLLTGVAQPVYSSAIPLTGSPGLP